MKTHIVMTGAVLVLGMVVVTTDLAFSQPEYLHLVRHRDSNGNLILAPAQSHSSHSEVQEPAVTPAALPVNQPKSSESVAATPKTQETPATGPEASPEAPEVMATAPETQETPATGPEASPEAPEVMATAPETQEVSATGPEASPEAPEVMATAPETQETPATGPEASPEAPEVMATAPETQETPATGPEASPEAPEVMATAPETQETPATGPEASPEAPEVMATAPETQETPATGPEASPEAPEVMATAPETQETPATGPEASPEAPEVMATAPETQETPATGPEASPEAPEVMATAPETQETPATGPEASPEAPEVMAATSETMPDTQMDSSDAVATAPLASEIHESSSAVQKTALPSQPKLIEQIRADWGMSALDVKANQTIPPSWELRNPVLGEFEHRIAYRTQIEGIDTSLSYTFYQDQLAQAKYVFEPQYEDSSNFIHDFHAVQDWISRSYGPPTSVQEIWLDTLYQYDKSLWGQALMRGHLVMVAEWKTADSRIALLLNGGDDMVGFVADFSSNRITGPEPLVEEILPTDTTVPEMTEAQPKPDVSL